MDIPRLSQIRTRMYRRLGKGTALTNTDLNSAIDDLANETLEEVFTAGDWAWKLARSSISTVASQEWAALPANFHGLYLPKLSLTDKSGSICILRDANEFETKRTAYTATGQPTDAVIETEETTATPRKVLRFVPTPDAVYAYDLPYRRRANRLFYATISAATKADPVVLTTSAHNAQTGDRIYISGVTGMTELNGNRYFAKYLSDTTLGLYTDYACTTKVNGTGYGTFSGTAALDTIPEIESWWVPAYLWRLAHSLVYDQQGREAAERIRRRAETAWIDAIATESSNARYSGPRGTLAENYDEWRADTQAALTGDYLP